MKKYTGYILISIGILIILFVLYVNSRYSNATRTFSPYTLLKSSWDTYKVIFLSKDGRIIDHSQNGITTSEGQSYAMLRAVWMDDKATFDIVWKFTQDNMKRNDDNLFGWRWGKRDDNSYGFLKDGGENSASDADSDIALALILAGRRWSNSEYIDKAKIVLADLWKINTEEINGKRYFLAGPWARRADDIVLNPSYFAPYAWRVFAEVDTERDWKSLIDPSYEVLRESGKAALDAGTSVGLPPDWVAVSRKDGAVKAADIPNLTTNYSFDAVRVPWRIALDYQWNRDGQAFEYLKSLSFLKDEYVKNNKLYSSYSHKGEKLVDYENPAMYSTAIAYFKIVDPTLAKKMYEEKIIALYSTDKNTFKDTLPYYEQNWLWFGAALYNDSLELYK